MHVVGDGHETPVRRPACAPAGSGAAWVVHRVPVDRSTSGVSLPALSVWDPTAVQPVLVAQETLMRMLPLCRALCGLGVCWIDQARPFQRSASVDVLSARSKLPTPVQALGATHETASSRLLFAPAGCGARRTDHRVAAAVATPLAPKASVHIPASVTATMRTRRHSL
ncbi:MAG: hypothetical protein ACXVR1_00660 [Solirubrobacteraceae bacterium]